MTTRTGDRVFCDTNVLLSAVDTRRALHREALKVFNALPNQGVELCISGQVLREFLAVSTRPVHANGLGLDVAQAVDNASAFVERSTVLAEHRQTAERLMRLVATARCVGKRVHDTNIVAVMLGHSVSKLITDNLAHFHSFGELEVINLSDV